KKTVEFKEKPHVIRFIDKLTGYRMVSTTVISNNNGSLTQKEVGYAIFEIICRGQGLVASKQEMDGELWFVAVYPDRPKLTQAKMNIDRYDISHFMAIDQTILIALFGVCRGIREPSVDCDVYSSDEYSMQVMLALWAMGYDLDSIRVREKYIHLKENVSKIVGGLWEKQG
ncbi:hypothetical protein H4J42_15880, partial [Colwellia sp. BRX8-8]|nr:hypothetical protein [Colwellia sp. BRX8-8]